MQEGADMRETGSKLRVVVAGYLATILLGIFFPSIAVIMYLAIAIYLFVPFRAVFGEIAGVDGD